MKDLQQILKDAENAEVYKKREEIFKFILGMIPIEFSKFRDLYEILQEVGEEENVIRLSLINLFLSECERKLPQFYCLEKWKGNEQAIQIHQFLEGIGSKCYSTINGFCVDISSVSPDCSDCFFRQICRAKSKK